MDRLKELIKYKGYQVIETLRFLLHILINGVKILNPQTLWFLLDKQVAPAELEALLITHPDILDAAVIPYVNFYSHCVFITETPYAFAL